MIFHKFCFLTLDSIKVLFLNLIFFALVQFQQCQKQSSRLKKLTHTIDVIF